MNRKTFIGTIATGIGALLNFPEKANAVAKTINASHIPSAPPSSKYPECSTSYVQTFDKAEKMPKSRIDQYGKIFMEIKGEWVHIGTAMKEALPRRA